MNESINLVAINGLRVVVVKSRIDMVLEGEEKTTVLYVNGKEIRVNQPFDEVIALIKSNLDL